MATPVRYNGIVHEVLRYYNFEEWSVRVKTYLLGKELWEVVEGNETKQEDDEVKSKAWRKNNAKALHLIQYCCGDDAFSCISGLSTAKDAWHTLTEEFERPGKIKILGNLVKDVSRRLDERSGNSDDELHGNVEDIEIKRREDERPVHGGVEPDDNFEDVEIEESKEEVDPETSSRASFFQHLKRAGRDDLDAAMDLVRQYPYLIRARSPLTGKTILHLAIGNDDLSVVNELVHLMKAKDLEIRDAEGYTAFSLATWNDDNIGIKMVECMVEKNKNLLTMWMPPQNRIPVGHAFVLSNWKMLDYFYRLTPPEALNSVHGAEFVSQAFFTLKFDKALDLINHFPNLATVKDNNGGTPLLQLASTRCAFLSGSRLKFWEKWIYNGIQIDYSKDCTTIDDERCRIFPAILFRLIPSNLRRILGISRIYQMKLNHARFSQFLDCMSQVTHNMDADQKRLVQKAIFEAVKRGHVEFITFLCDRNTELFYIHDIDGKHMFHFAIECRQEKVYNLIYELDDSTRKHLTSICDQFYNNMLHAAGRVSPFAQLDKIQGAALQMQRELQWFKEVENIVPIQEVEFKNFKERLTARELFTENHKELVKAGESSMKDTATSCTVVGALIVTIMFAAVFTVPGGNSESNGAPMFIHKKLFMVFIASDAISLFSSTTSVMIFLGIFTSRYGEEDFLTSLPTKMIFGLLTLFISVTSMMIAFSSALFFMHDELWIVGPVSFLASVPVLTFVWMQTPLFVATLKSTYGKGIFKKKLKRRN